MIDPILDTWQIHCRINSYLLEAIPDEALWTKVDKAKAVGAQFTHMHAVRGMWLKASAPALHEGFAKVEDKAGKAEIQAALDDSSARVLTLLEQALRDGKVKNFRPHPLAFLGYLIAHEAHHRGQAELLLRQLGHAIPDKVSYGLWEWGAR